MDFRSFTLQWLEQRGMSRSRLAESADINQSLISKYLNDDEWRRAIPSTESLTRLAPAMGVELTDLLQMCGYLPGEPATLPEEDAIERDVNARLAEYLAAVRGTPRWAWTTIVNAGFDRVIADAETFRRVLPPEAPADSVLPGRKGGRARQAKGVPPSSRRQRTLRSRALSQASP